MENTLVSFLSMMIQRRKQFHFFLETLGWRKQRLNRRQTCSGELKTKKRQTKSRDYLINAEINSTPLPLSFSIRVNFFCFFWEVLLEKRNRKDHHQSQRAPASLRRGTRVPLICEAMTLSMVPTSFPPINTTGTEEEPPRSLIRAFSISLPLGSSSSSCTVGFTPIPQNNRLMA